MGFLADKRALILAGKVFLADGNAYFNRPGPRLVESLEILAACIDGERVDLRKKHAESVRRVTEGLELQPF